MAEVFRKADWVDVSLGFIKFGLSPVEIKEISNKFPNSGFHARLLQLTMRELVRNPLNPLPMMKW